MGARTEDSPLVTRTIQVTKGRPVTGCRKEPIELCTTDGCGFSEVGGHESFLTLEKSKESLNIKSTNKGKPDCREEKVSVIGEKPVEECQVSRLC